MSSNEKRKKAILNGLVFILHPLARLCIRNSLKIHEFLEAVKLAFIQEAEKELTELGKSASASRISVMTGVNRRDITRLLKEEMDVTRFPDITSRVLGTWQSDKRFLTGSGKPKALHVEGKESEFSDLVRAVSSDVAPYTVLHELERLGVVEKKEDKVKLISRIYVNPPENFEDGYAMLGEDARDLVYAVDDNLSEPKETPNLHLKTEFAQVSKKHLDQVRDWLLTEGSRFHRKVREYLSAYDLDVNPKLRKGNTGERVVYTSYSLTQEHSVPTNKGENDGNEKE